MTKTTNAALLAIALLTIGASSAFAAAVPRVGLTAQDVVAWLTTKSVTSSVQQDKDGLDYVKAPGDVTYDVNLYDCDKLVPRHCKALQFSAGWSGDFTTEQSNKWNRDWRYLKAYVTDDNKAIWVQYDVPLTDETTYGELGDDLARWQARLVTFKGEVLGAK